MSDDRQPPTCGGQAMEYDALTRQWQCDCGRDVAAEFLDESAIEMRSFKHVRSTPISLVVNRRRSGDRPRWMPRAEWFARRRVSGRRNRRDRNRPMRIVWPTVMVDSSTTVRIDVVAFGSVRP